MATILPVIQIVIAAFLIAGIILQSSAAGMGALGGGDSIDAGYHTRRGFEKWLFNATLVLALLFAIVSFIIFIAH